LWYKASAVSFFFPAAGGTVDDLHAKRPRFSKWFVLLVPVLLAYAVLTLQRGSRLAWETTIPVADGKCCSRAELLVRDEGIIVTVLTSGGASMLDELNADGSLIETTPLPGYACCAAVCPDGSVIVGSVKNKAIELSAYDIQGNTIWTRQSRGGPHSACVEAVAATHPDGVAATGYFAGAMTFGNAEGPENLLQHREEDAWVTAKGFFAAAFSNGGSLRWQQSWPGRSWGLGVAGMAGGITVAAGEVFNHDLSLRMKDGNGITIRDYPMHSLLSTCMCAYDWMGEILWVRQFGGVDDLRLAASPDGTRVYAIAVFSEHLDVLDLNGRRSIERTVDGVSFGFSPENAAVLAFDAGGKFLWGATWPLKRFQFLPDFSLDSPPDPFPVDCTAANERVLVSYPLQEWRPFTKKPNPVFQIAEIDNTGRMRRRGRFTGPPKDPCLAPPQIAALADGSFVYLTCSPEGAELANISRHQ
jgi:hypothetical protein